MAVGTAALFAFNRGIISKLGLARTDLKRQALSAEIQTNWMPRMLGSMMLRPGLGYVATSLQSKKAKHIPFVFATDDLAIIELTDSNMRVYVDDAIVTRASVATEIANGTFDTDLTGWTNDDESGASSIWVTGGYMQLTGTGFNNAIRYQSVLVAESDINVEHALRIVVAQESVTLRVGTDSTDDSYINETILGVGTHSLAFTPTGTSFVVRLSSNVNVDALVDSVTIEASGDMELPTPWAEDDLPLIRHDQSADVIFLACDGFQQRKIERRGVHSWSVVLYQPDDGPFLLENTGPITLTPSATTGPITLTASAALFRSGHVGALFKIASVGQHTDVAAAGTSEFSSAIEVSGLTDDRNIAITITGTFVGTVVLQRSIAAPGAWEDVPDQSFTGPTTVNYNDELDNQVIFYRIGIDDTYTSGTADCALDITTGSITGVCRITSVTDSTTASANVLTLPGNTGILAGLGSTNASADWWEGQWSDYRGWPTAVCFYEGRLWWFGRGNIWGSVSDAFASFDDTVTGDSGPINRSVGSGPVDVINWGLPLQRLMLGGQGAEISIRSSSLDEPLTPTNFNLKDASTQGSMAAAAVKIDSNGAFIDRSERRVYELIYDYTLDGIDYSTSDLTNFVPDIAITPGGFTKIAVQRKPDTRIHGLMADGTAAVLIYDPNENEHAWIIVSTPGGSGVIEDVVILPGTVEDQVYYLVKRTINGSTVRYLEKWAREDECYGADICKLADSFITGTNSPASATISGLDTLEGQQVVVWADGKDVGTASDGTLLYTVSGGEITLDAAVSNYVVGLFYDAKFQSSKLAYAAKLGTALTQRKRVIEMGLIAANLHPKGLQFGKDFDHLRDLPNRLKGVIQDQDTVISELDLDPQGFAGDWDTDSRLCLYAKAPRPATVLAAVLGIETEERI